LAAGLATFCASVCWWYIRTTDQNSKAIVAHTEQLQELTHRADANDHRVDGIEARINQRCDRASAQP
jgi:hypothetical protein